MTLISLSDCCRLLTIDPKTLRRWLDLAHVPLLPHPTDARSKGITASQVCQIATAHRRRLADFPEAAPPPVPLVNARGILRRNNFDPPCQIPFPFNS